MLYYILYGFFYLFSLLPLGVLYILADFIYLILFHLVGYRKKVVIENITGAFPEKSSAEIKKITRQFYHNFCDQIVEMIKQFSISKKSLNKRFTGDWEVFEKLYNENKNVYGMMAHNFNWEWTNIACQFNCKQYMVGVYMHVDNPSIEKLLLKLRTKTTNAIMISAAKFKEEVAKIGTKKYAMALVSDQNPSNTIKAQWIDFFGKEAPFYRGPSQGAIRAGAAVVFAHVEKIKRGYYHLHFLNYCDDASTLSQEKIMIDFVRFVEEKITLHPDNWLWSHRRWKHKKDF